MKSDNNKLVLITLLLSILVLMAMIFVHLYFQVPIKKMTQDVTSFAHIHPLSGILSNLGILLWCVTASVCGFTAILLRKTRTGDSFHFFLFSSLLSAYLLVDDLFLIHESLFRRLFNLDDKIPMILLGIGIAAYLIAFRRILLRTNFIFYSLAVGFLAISAGLDFFLESWMNQFGEWKHFFEDGAKWLGITCWCSYYVHTSYRFLVSLLDQPGNSTQEEAQASHP